MIIALPSGLQSHDISALTSALLADDVNRDAGQHDRPIVVEILYRHGLRHQFPTPVHDTLFAFDWICAHLVDGSRIASPRIGVAGELVGGSLAAMLALTECHASSRVPRIVAAAVNEPILDWSAFDGPDNVVPKERSRKTAKTRVEHAVLNAPVLKGIRNELFASKATFEDQFASPLLFFRHATSHEPDQEDVSTLSRSSDSTEQSSGIPPHKPITQRSKIYPSKSSALSLPTFRISSGTGSILRPQLSDFAKVVRRAIVRTSSLRDAEHGAHDGVELVTTKKSHLWSQAGRGELEDIAGWFRNVL